MVKTVIMARHKIIKLINWNANGIRNKLLELEELLNRAHVDVCFVTETKLSTKLERIYIKNFNCYRADREAANTGGGVAILINKRLGSVTIPYTIDNKKITSIETVAVKINDIMFIAAYKNPQTESIMDDLKFLYNSHDKIIMAGDINAKHTAWGNSCHNKTGKILIKNKILNKFKFDIINTDEPTYYSPITMSGSNLDLFFTKNMTINKPITVNELSSDHLPVMAKIIHRSNNNNNDKNIFNYSKTDWDQYKKELNLNWVIKNKFDDNSEVESTICNLNQLMHNALQLATPIRKNNEFKYDINESIKNLINYRNRIRKTMQKHKCITCKKIVNTLNNQIKYRLQEFKNDKLSKTMKKLNIRDGTLWNAVRLSKWRNNKSKKIYKIYSQYGITFDKKQIADSFADSFEKIHHMTINLGNTELNNIIKRNYERIADLDNDGLAFQINSHEIKDLFKKLKTKKAPGIDNVSNLQLKNSTNKIICQINYIFNHCIRNTYFPKIWRKAKIIPIPKPGKDHLFPQNFRPISLLSTLSKVFESIIAKRMRKHLDKNKCLNEAQFGFRSGYCTVRQLSRVIYYILANKNKNKHTGVMLLDIEKAFDTVCHKALLYKMKIIGIPNNIIQLIKSYLTARQFVVSHDGVTSSHRNIVAGVPQGSVLGPLLFLMYINDIPELEDNVLALFADDTAIIASSGSHNILKRKIVNHFDMLNGFFNSWKIKINQLKTELLIVGYKNFNYKMNITYNGQTINSVNSIKYLGVIIDNKLNFNKHIATVITKAKAAMSILYNLIKNKNITINNKITIYKTCIRPILTYACPVWCSVSKSNMNKLQIIQNKCLNIILDNHFYIGNTNYMSVKKCHKKANIETVETFVDRLSNNFYNNKVDNISILKNRNKIINSAWDKTKYPHQKYT